LLPQINQTISIYYPFNF